MRYEGAAKGFAGKARSEQAQAIKLATERNVFRLNGDNISAKELDVRIEEAMSTIENYWEMFVIFAPKIEGPKFLSIIAKASLYIGHEEFGEAGEAQIMKTKNGIQSDSGPHLCKFIQLKNLACPWLCDPSYCVGNSVVELDKTAAVFFVEVF